jgi:hypothetical protein
MERRRPGTFPNPQETALVKLIAIGLNALSTDATYPVSEWQLCDYLEQNCPEARGNDSNSFFKEKVPKALDRMEQTQMIERKVNGFFLTDNGLYCLIQSASEQKGADRDPDGSTIVSKHTSTADGFPHLSLLEQNELKLQTLRVRLTPGLLVVVTPALLLRVTDDLWNINDFRIKVEGIAPTLLLIKLKNGVECGGVADIPWINPGTAVPGEGSFIFSLGDHPRRFDLIKSEGAVVCRSVFFGFGEDLRVWSNGWGCSSAGEVCYAGPRKRGQLTGARAGADYREYESWELWRL